MICSRDGQTLLKHEVSKDDILVGIAASGGTPYVLGAVERANEFGCLPQAFLAIQDQN